MPSIFAIALVRRPPNVLAVNTEHPQAVTRNWGFFLLYHELIGQRPTVFGQRLYYPPYGAPPPLQLLGDMLASARLRKNPVAYGSELLPLGERPQSFMLPTSQGTKNKHLLAGKAASSHLEVHRGFVLC